MQWCAESSGSRFWDRKHMLAAKIPLCLRLNVDEDRLCTFNVHFAQWPETVQPCIKSMETHMIVMHHGFMPLSESLLYLCQKCSLYLCLKVMLHLCHTTSAPNRVCFCFYLSYLLWFMVSSPLWRMVGVGNRGFSWLRLSEFAQISESFQFKWQTFGRHLSHLPNVLFWL